MLTLPVVPIPLELNMFCLSQLDYVLGKRLGREFSSHYGRGGSGWMSGGACHAQLYTGSFLLCPVLFLGMSVKVGWTNIYCCTRVLRKKVALQYRVCDLLWRPVERLVRFVVVIHPPRGRL